MDEKMSRAAVMQHFIWAGLAMRALRPVMAEKEWSLVSRWATDFSIRNSLSADEFGSSTSSVDDIWESLK